MQAQCSQARLGLNLGPTPIPSIRHDSWGTPTRQLAFTVIDLKPQLTLSTEKGLIMQLSLLYTMATRTPPYSSLAFNGSPSVQLWALELQILIRWGRGTLMFVLETMAGLDLMFESSLRLPLASNSSAHYWVYKIEMWHWHLIIRCAFFSKLFPSLIFSYWFDIYAHLVFSMDCLF